MKITIRAVVFLLQRNKRLRIRVERLHSELTYYVGREQRLSKYKDENYELLQKLNEQNTEIKYLTKHHKNCDQHHTNKT